GLRELAREHGVELRDLREPPHDLSTATGANLEVDATIVLTVGSDCAIGKMTATCELDLEARTRGLKSVVVPTGQTGIAIAGWAISVDAVVSDFLAGAAERLVVEGAKKGDLLWVEGQGAILHPIYSGVTVGLIHGSAPHLYVLCHEVGRTVVEGDPTASPIVSLRELVDLHERMSLKLRPAKVACVALNTAPVSEEDARAAIARAEDETGLPAADPVRFGATILVDARGRVATPNGVQLFAEYGAKVAERYRYVRKMICLNGGNQPRFHQPQFDDAGNGISGFVQEQAMAACYGALKSVDPGIDVIAFGLSPRGNDDFDAVSNVSHSPIRFLKQVGDAYRASGRTTPIADDVSLHCYPNLNTDAPSVGYQWPKVGCVNLDRFKQAWWDAFHGTGQPLFREAGPSSPGPFVRIYVDEVGYQARVAADKAALYTGAEN